MATTVHKNERALPRPASARRAARKFFVFSLLEGLAPIYPVYMLMFEGRGYGFTAVSLLLSIWSLPVVALELPSGVLADRWSKKGVIAIGMTLKALCFGFWALSPSYWVAALGFVLWGTQEALCSGARQALLYEALKRKDLAEEYETVVGLSGAIELTAVAVSMVAGAAIYAVSPLLALCLSSLSSAAAAAVALRFQGQGIDGASRATPSSLLGELQECVRSKALTGLLLAICVAGAAYATIDEFDGLWAASRYSVPIAWVGAWGAIRMGAQGLGGLIAGPVSRRLRMRRTGGTLVLAGLLFAVSAFLPGRWGIPPYFVYFFVLEAVSVIFEARLQEAADDASRASLLSLSSWLLTLVAFVIAPVFGAAADAGGLAWTIAICGGLTSVSGVFLISVRRPRLPTGR